jgi:hypothetical protein
MPLRLNSGVLRACHTRSDGRVEQDFITGEQFPVGAVDSTNFRKTKPVQGRNRARHNLSRRTDRDRSGDSQLYRLKGQGDLKMTSSTSYEPQSDTTDAESVRTSAEELASDVRHTAEEAGRTAMREARVQAEDAKDGVADEISSIGNALRRTADELRTGSPQERTFGSMATAMADLADTVRDKDFGEMVNDVSAFARRNPVAFLGGAALLGFAGMRVAKASQRDRHVDDRYRAAGAAPSVPAGTPQPAPTYQSDPAVPRAHSRTVTPEGGVS